MTVGAFASGLQGAPGVTAAFEEGKDPVTHELVDDTAVAVAMTCTAAMRTPVNEPGPRQ